jgi:hypothetical protein
VNDTDFEELPEQEPSWLRLERATACRKRLLATGYAPLPVNGKAPPFAGWQDIAATNKIIETWETKYPDAASTGILTVSVPTIDIDIMHPEAAAAIEALAREHFEERGHILVRFGKAPKRAILLRTDEPFKKIVRKFTLPDGSEQKIEVLGNGQQVVCYGLHKDTRQPYSWHGGEPSAVKREDLPYVRQAEMEAFIDAAAELLTREFGFKPINDKRRPDNGKKPQSSAAAASVRERAYAQAALEGCAAELAGAAPGGRNDLLNKLAFRLGRMCARGWIDRADIETALLEAMQANGGVADDGLVAAEATLKSGLEDGMQEPHPDLPDGEAQSENKTKTDSAAAPAIEPWPIERVLETFERWLILPSRNPVYAVLGAVAANLLPGIPVWLGLVAPPSSAKTEILNSISTLPNVYQAATLTPAALLSGVPKKQHHKTAVGGLLRQIGDFGIISLKDFGSVLSMRPDAKAEVLAALREIYDGSWTRHLGTDGGRTLAWRGKVGLIFGCTGVIDGHYSVIGSMGDRFLLNRLEPCKGQFQCALRHSGAATEQMQKELAEAVVHLFAGARTEPRPFNVESEEFQRLDRVVSLVVRLRGAVERDRYSREVEAIYGAEGTARLGLTLERLLAGLDTIGVDRTLALDVVEDIAMDSVPPTRCGAYEFLQDIAPAEAETAAVAKHMGLPTTTARRALEELAAYNLVERTGQGQGKPDLWCAT